MTRMKLAWAAATMPMAWDWESGGASLGERIGAKEE